jgi:hypothetical protein
VKRAVVAAASVAIVLGAPAARAEPFSQKKQEDVVAICIETFEKAQIAQKQGRFVDAIDAFEACSSERCPSAVRHDCLQSLDRAHRAAPSITLVVRNAAGEDIDVPIELDGRRVTAPRGQAIEADVGEHVATYTIHGVRQKAKFTVYEGEKSRVVVLRPDPAATRPEEAPAASERREPLHLFGPLALGLVGAGLVAWSIGSFVAYDTRRAKFEQAFNDACPEPPCTATQIARQKDARAAYDANEEDGTKAAPVWIALSTVGVLSIAGAIAWFIVAAPTQKTSVTPLIGPSFAGLAFGASP